MKIITAKKFIIAILIAILMSASTLYISFLSLEIYKWNGDLVTEGEITYQDSPELFKHYLEGSIKTERTIGRFKEDKFLGFKTWVIKLQNFDEKDAFLIRGLMFEALYVKLNQ